MSTVNSIAVGDAFGVPIVRIRRPSASGSGKKLASDIMHAIRDARPNAVHPAARF